MKKLTTTLRYILTNFKKPYVYTAVALLLLAGLSGTAVAMRFNQTQPIEKSTRDATVDATEDSKSNQPEAPEAVTAEPVQVAAPETPESTPVGSATPPKTTTKTTTKSTTAPAPQLAQTQPTGMYTSGQTFCDSSIIWGSIVEASFSHYRGQSASSVYHLEVTTSGLTRVLYTGTIAVPADGTFDIRPPSSTATWAPNVRQGDVLRIHLLSPFDTYSKPYNVESFTAGCSS